DANCIRRFDGEDMVGYAGDIWITADRHISYRQGKGRIYVARIKLNHAALRRDRFFPVPKAALDKTDRPQHIDIVRKAFLGDKELLQRAGEIAFAIVAVETHGKMRFG